MASSVLGKILKAESSHFAHMVSINVSYNMFELMQSLKMHHDGQYGRKDVECWLT